MRRVSEPGAAAAALVTAFALSLAPAAARGVEFEPEQEGGGPPALAAGPVSAASAHVSADVGYVRSGLRADVGFGADLDLVLRAEVFTTKQELIGEKGFFVGMRWSPVAGDGLRMSVAAEVGYSLSPVHAGDRELLSVRGELVVGHHVLGILPYGRAALRGIHWDASIASGWDEDGEVGFGVERAFGRLLTAAEVYAWLQPGERGLAQWRLRVGWAF